MTNIKTVLTPPRIAPISANGLPSVGEIPFRIFRISISPRTSAGIPAQHMAKETIPSTNAAIAYALGDAGGWVTGGGALCGGTGGGILCGDSTPEALSGIWSIIFF